MKYKIIIIFLLLTLMGCKDKSTKKSVQLTKEELDNKLKESFVLRNISEVEDLLDKGADKNIILNHKSILCNCILEDRVFTAIKLIDMGADINLICEDNSTALSCSLKRNNIVITKKLIDKNVLISNESARIYFKECIINENYELLNILISYDKFYEKIQNDYSLLSTLINNWNVNTIDIIEKIYDSTFSIPDEYPVLFYCIENLNLEAIKYFNKRGVNINKRYYDEYEQTEITPLQKAYICYPKEYPKSFDGDENPNPYYYEDKPKMDSIINFLETYSYSQSNP